MNSPRLEDLSQQQRDAIDSINKRFSEHEASFEQLLTEVDDKIRPHVFRRLLAADVDRCERLGETISASLYQQRFPDHSDEIAKFFDELLNESENSSNASSADSPSDQTILTAPDETNSIVQPGASPNADDLRDINELDQTYDQCPGRANR